MIKQFYSKNMITLSKQFKFQIIIFQAIQYSISTQFSSIRPIDRTLSVTIITGQSEPGSHGSEGVLSLSQNSSLTIRLFSPISRKLVAGVLPPKRCSQCILQPQPTGQGWYVFGILEEARRTHQPKRCEYNNTDEDNRRKTLNDNKLFPLPLHLNTPRTYVKCKY